MARRHVSGVVPPALAIVAFAAQTFAQGPTGTIRATVVDPQGGTLVVDAIGFRDRGWLNFNGQPHSDRLHVVERLRRPDLGHLEIEITLDDPGAFQKKWTGALSATLAPDIELHEFVCTENNKAPALIPGR